MNNSFLVDEKGFYGVFGGAYVPEILYATVENLRREYLPIIDSEDFRKEYAQLLRDFVGRPSPLYFAKRMSERYGCKLYLKREDLNHTGAHKINNTIGQILLAKKMGKKRIIAETGAGQHGVATAIVCALMDMPRVVYQGALDVERQHVNVERMKMLGTDAAENGGVKIIRYGYAPPHPSLYCHRELFNIYGTYKNDYAIAADFEFMVRLLSHECVISLYLPLNMVTMRTGGISSRPHNRIIVNTRETKRALKENGVEASYAHLIKRYVTKVRQYISAYSTVDNASSIFKTLRYCTSQETSLHTPRKASSVLR